MPDSNVATGSENQPQNSPSGSSSVTNDANKTGSNNTGASGPTVKDNPELLKEVRLNGRKEERRKIASLLKEHGHDVNGKNLEDTLRTILSGTKPKADADPKSGQKPEVDKKAKRGEGTGEEEFENSQFQRTLVAKDEKINTLTSRLNTLAVNGAIAESTAGITFANEEAAQDAIAAFKSTYRFELDEESQQVRVIDSKGEPFSLNGYQDASLRDTFKAFVEKRPHFLKGDKRPGQSVTDSKGTTTAATNNINAVFNDAIRKAAGL